MRIVMRLAILGLVALGPGACASSSDDESTEASDGADAGTAGDTSDSPNDAVDNTEPDTDDFIDIGPPPDFGKQDVDLPPGDVIIPPPDQGPPPDPMTCTGNINGQLQPFGGSCCYTTPSHSENGDCIWYSDSYNNGVCLHLQCDTTLCSRPASYCTKQCTMGADLVVNATGQPGQDGIADEDGFDDCSGAEDGPVGTAFRCVNQNDPDEDAIGMCRPGTTFASCDSNKECPDGETCQLYFILGATQSRCGIPEKGALALGEACNSDPNSGPVSKCGGPFCFNYGCIDLCAEDGDCLTDTCDGGKCTKSDKPCESSSECSAFACEEMMPYNNSAYTDDFCQGRHCNTDKDCNDPDWFCRPFWNGADVIEDVEVSPRCRPKEPGKVDYGEACGVPGDGTDLPECVWSGGCIDNICMGPCQSDADCADGVECLQQYQWNIDVNDDDEVDTYLNVDLCTPWPTAELTDCSNDADCPDGEHCQFRVKASGVGDAKAWEIQYKCRANYADQAEPNQACGSASGDVCKTDLCLISNSNPDAPATCYPYCQSQEDCAGTVKYEGITYKTVCQSFRSNRQDSPALEDDLYVPYCARTSSFGSLKSCEETRKCANPKEYCRALPIAGNPDQPTAVQHVCSDASEGLDEIPKKKVGDVCETWTECLGRNCLPDDKGTRYCSELCKTDDDCKTPGGIDGLKCTDQVVIPRDNPMNAGVTQRCILQKACTVCETSDQCGGPFVCANFGTLGFNADYRCAEPCDTTEDCSDASALCVENIDSTGAPTGSSFCQVECGG